MKLFINGKEVKGNGFVWDGCHKIYIIEDDNDLRDCTEKWGTLVNGTDIFDITKIEKIYDDSCSLRFISNWKLNTQYVRQFEDATFDWVGSDEDTTDNYINILENALMSALDELACYKSDFDWVNELQDLTGFSESVALDFLDRLGSDNNE